MTEQQIRKVAIYARQSSGDNEDRSESIGLQLERLQELAEARGWEVVGIFKDADTSGRTYPDTAEARALIRFDEVTLRHFEKRKSDDELFRKGLGRVMNILPEVHAVLVYDQTRLMRPLSDSHLESHIRQKLSRHLLVTADGRIMNYNEFATGLVGTIQNRVLDDAVKKIARRASEGRNKARMEGKIWSDKFYKLLGYRKGRDKGTVEVIEEEADTVRRIFRLYTDRIGVAKIIQILNAEGRKTKRNGTWYSATIHHMIENVGYIGYDRLQDGTLVRVKAVKPIIDEGMFWKASNIRKGHKKAGARNSKIKVHPLSGLLYCSHCGRKLIVAHDSNSAYPSDFYICPNARYRHDLDLLPECRTVRLNENKATDQWGFIRTGILQAMVPFIMGQVVSEYHDRQKDSDLEGEAQRLEADLEALNRRTEELAESFAVGSLPLKAFEKASEQLDNRSSELKNEIQKVKDSIRDHKASGTEFPWEQYWDLTTEVIDYESPIIRQFRAIARRTFERLEVSRHAVKVILSDGTEAVIPREKVGTSHMLPVASFGFRWDNFKYHEGLKIMVRYADKSAWKEPSKAVDFGRVILDSDSMYVEFLTV